MAAIVAAVARPGRCQDPRMAATDDPAVPPAPAVPAPPAPAASRAAGSGPPSGSRSRSIAVVLAVSYGVAAATTTARIVDGGGGAPRPRLGARALAGAGDPGAAHGLRDYRGARRDWVPIGARTDRLEGRDTPPSSGSGPAAGSPTRRSRAIRCGRPGDAAAGPAARGVLLRSFDVGGRTAVTWNENGHTAVISAIGISRAALYNLAGGPARAAASRSG